MRIGKKFNFELPQLTPLHATTIQDQTLFKTAGQANFVGLFIGIIICIAWLNIANANNHRCRPHKDDRQQKY
jgi:hypothetical protein